MKKYKFGFTLSEVLIAMAVIGVVLALSVNAIKTARASYTALAYFAHKNITNLAGVLYSGADVHSVSELTSCTNGVIKIGKNCNNGTSYYKFSKLQGEELFKDGSTSVPSIVTRCYASDSAGKNYGKYINVLMNDSETVSALGGECKDRAENGSNYYFCKALAGISNTAGAPDCSFAYSVTKGAEPSFDADSFDINKPNFTFTNGMKVYISKWVFDSTNVSKEFGYRLVGIDLNGKSNPNKITQSGAARPADFAVFLVLDNSEVYPLGLAADNLQDGNRIIQYINAKVRGYYFSAYSTRLNEKETVASRGTKMERSSGDIPAECQISGLDSGYDKFKCNLGVVSLHNPANAGSNQALSNFSYRKALCTAKGPKDSTDSDKSARIGYIKYCTEKGYYRDDKCPPSSLAYSNSCAEGSTCPFDQCRVETVKPVFRYNFQ